MDRFISTALFCKVKGCSNSSGNFDVIKKIDLLSLSKAITFSLTELEHAASEI